MEYLKKQKFSIRKLTLGVASVFLCNTFYASVDIVNAEEKSAETIKNKSEEKIKVKYLAIDEAELTDIEKNLVIRDDISKEIAETNDTYIEVYVKEEKTLPNTGHSSKNYLAALGVLGLLAVYRIGKNKNKYLVGVILLTSATLGTSVVNSVEAENTIKLITKSLSSYISGENLEKISISNYRYVGYIKSKDILDNSTKYGRLYELIKPELEMSNNKIEEKLNIDKNTSEESLTKTEIVSKSQEIPFVEIEEPTADLYEGEKEVKIVGENGEKTTIYKNYVVNGEVIKVEELSTSITKSPINQIVKVGTKKKETTKPTDNLTTEEKPSVDFVEELSTRIESIPFTELEEKTDELYEGEREIKVVGVAGE
ncbi:G5 domain-containing protein, partial [Gemelliphila palaticanis]